MGSVALYLASDRELSTPRGATFDVVDTTLAHGGRSFEVLRDAAPAAPRFERAMRMVDDDTAVVVGLRDEGSLLQSPGTTHLWPVFDDWATLRDRDLDILPLPNTSDVTEFYEAVEHWIDEQAAEPHVDHVQVFLGGDSAADAMAAIACLHGPELPSELSVWYDHADSAGGRAFRPLDVAAPVSYQLLREHARERVQLWEFQEVRGLALVHVNELHDVTPTLDAASRYVQRKHSALDEAGFVHDDIPEQWTATRDLCHALDIAEYRMTVARDEEQVAWYVQLALRELAPMAWAERYLSELRGEPVTLEDGLRWVTETYLPNLLVEGNALLAAVGVPPLANVPGSGTDVSAQHLLARVGAPALQGMDGPVLRGPLPDELPPAALEHVLFVALHRGLAELRHALAHRFLDLDERSLVRELHLGATASATQVELLLRPAAGEPAPASSTVGTAAALRERLEAADLLPRDAFQPVHLGEASAENPLRRIAGVFNPLARDRVNPLVAVQAHLVDALAPDDGT